MAINRQGGDCYSYGLLAGGYFDVLLEAGLDPHDFLPMVVLIECAGGVVTDWGGRTLGPRSDGTILAAATADLHRQALALLAECGTRCRGTGTTRQAGAQPSWERPGDG